MTEPRISPPKTYKRFDLTQRLEHGIFMASFSMLGLTGLIQKFSSSPISLMIMRFLGGIENTRQIHHIAAIVMILVSIFHVLNVLYRILVLRTRLSMLPWLDDFKHLFQDIAYYLGLRKQRAYYGRYNYAEKVEYLAVVWGTLLMGLTGFLMWNPISTTRFLPGEFIPAAKAAHGAEAVLAVLAIIVWHMYGVHLKRFNKSMWTGHLTEEDMLHEHPLELADIKAGTVGQLPPTPEIRRRRLVYYPIAAIVAAVLLFAVYGFVRGEDTAITTVPPREVDVPIFVPQTPTPLPPTPTPRPSPTPVPTTEVAGPTVEGAIEPLITWSDVGPIFAGRCAVCHSAALASGGLALDTYAAAVAGGQGGPVIVSGDAIGSRLIVVQSAGGHPGQLSAEELAIISAWIDAGALEE